MPSATTPSVCGRAVAVPRRPRRQAGHCGRFMTLFFSLQAAQPRLSVPAGDLRAAAHSAAAVPGPRLRCAVPASSQSGAAAGWVGEDTVKGVHAMADGTLADGTLSR